TEHDSVYAFDADDPNSGDPLWSVSLGRAVPSIDISPDYTDLVPEIGITATPIIDPASGIVYVVAKTEDGNGVHQKLHALDITNGGERLGGPVEIRASVASTAADSVAGTLSFNPLMQLNRPALLLSRGNVYIAFGSHQDFGQWHGWVMAYNAETLSQTAVFCTTPDGYAGGIWGAGQGVTADPNGNIYVSTGNGDCDSERPNGGDFGDSVIKLSSTLSLIDWFAPADQASLDANDLDIGSGASLLLPGTTLLALCGKDGVLRLIDTNTMGRFDPSTDNDQQEFQAVNGHFMGKPVYWNSSDAGPVVYLWGESDFLKRYKFSGTQFQTSPISRSTVKVADGYSNSAPLTLSSNGSQPGTAIIWAFCPQAGDANTHTVHGILRAFDATDLSRELWDSTLNTSRDDAGNYAKFCPPVVADGKVYVASFSGVLNVYGLLGSQSGSQSMTIDPANASFGTSGGTGTVSIGACGTCAWTASSNADWIGLTSNASGTGDGTINYSVTLNEGPSRTGAIAVSGQTVTVGQTSGCWFGIDPTSQAFGPAGGGGTVSIRASSAGCRWSAASGASWVTITSAATGTGDGAISYSVARKRRPNRSATLTVGGATITVSQSSTVP
ncbi:MAG: BACON domain-containing protein, partial [Blastocatellia bacterium]